MISIHARPGPANAALFVAAAIASVGSFISTTPLTVTASGVCLALVVLLLWRNDEPPILFVPVLFQWSEVAIWPLSTIWRQMPLNELSPWGADLEPSALYGLTGVAGLAVGLRIGSGRTKGVVPFAMRLRSEAMLSRFHDVALVAFIAMAAGYTFSAASGVAGPARELFNQAGSLKYVGLFVLAYWCMVHNSHYRVLGLVMAFEIIFGMTGFFADFKNSVLTFLIAALAARPRFRPLDILLVGFSVVVLLVVAIFWSAVKHDYRILLNDGSGEQVVTVSLSERIDFLADAASSMDGERIALGFNKLVDRHGYIEFLGLTLKNVPEAMPHENGRLTLAVLNHILAPRLLFPDKPPLPSDSEVTAIYTGLDILSTWSEDTSISIGNLGELYVDFGLLGGIVALSGLGWLVGANYRRLRNRKSSPASVSAGFCVMVTLPLAYFGTAYIKLVGALIFSSAIAILIQRFVLPHLLRKLSKQKLSPLGASRWRN